MDDFSHRLKQTESGLLSIAYFNENTIGFRYAVFIGSGWIQVFLIIITTDYADKVKS